MCGVIEITDHDRAEIAAQERTKRLYAIAMSRYGDCSDPRHDGCPLCEPDAFEVEDWQ